MHNGLIEKTTLMREYTKLSFVHVLKSPEVICPTALVRQQNIRFKMR